MSTPPPSSRPGAPAHDLIPEGFHESRLEADVNVKEIHAPILREKDEPRDGYEPVPLWLVTLFMAIVFWGGAYLAWFSGGFDATVFNPTQVSWSGAGVAAAAAPPDPKVIGKRLFTANCVACHQSTGLGVPGQFPPLAGSEWVVSAEWHGDNHLIKTVLHGLQGPVQVAGNTYSGVMPPWAQLKDEQIAAILTYIRSEWGNDAPPITPDQVARVRAEHPDRTEPWTQRELQAIPAVHYHLTDDAPPAPDAENAAPPAPETQEAPQPQA